MLRIWWCNEVEEVDNKKEITDPARPGDDSVSGMGEWDGGTRTLVPVFAEGFEPGASGEGDAIAVTDTRRSPAATEAT